MPFFDTSAWNRYLRICKYMKSSKNVVVTGYTGKPMAVDIFCPEGGPAPPLVLYAHGFNGFKDWGRFDLIAEQFAEAGLCLVKFNFSHNGTTPGTPEEFTDLEAFGQNNYTKELEDLQTIIDWCLKPDNPHAAAYDRDKLYLLGHSMGGGIVLLKGAEEQRVKAIATWASIAECKTPWGRWTDEQLDRWKRDGVVWYTNSRTKQQMPLYYQLYEDYQQHSQRLDIINAVKHMHKPLLICHGTQDEAVPVQSAYRLKETAPQAELFTIASDHVFGRKHPWTADTLPPPMQAVVDKTIEFFKKMSGE